MELSHQKKMILWFFSVSQINKSFSLVLTLEWINFSPTDKSKYFFSTTLSRDWWLWEVLVFQIFVRIHFNINSCLQTMCRCYRWGKPKQRKLPKITKWKIKQQKCLCSSFINSSRKNFENVSTPSDDITCKTSMTFNFIFCKGHF